MVDKNVLSYDLSRFKLNDGDSKDGEQGLGLPHLLCSAGVTPSGWPEGHSYVNRGGRCELTRYGQNDSKTTIGRREHNGYNLDC